MNVTAWISKAHSLAIDKGWWEDSVRDPERLCMLMVSELAEAMEHRRKPELDGLCDKCNGDGCPKCNGTGDALGGSRYLEECADVVIRLFDTCGAFDIDFGPWVKPAIDQVAQDVVHRPLLTHEGSMLRAAKTAHDLAQELRKLERIRETKPLMIDEYVTQQATYAGISAAKLYAWTLYAADVDAQRLERVVELKHAYNSTRPHKHGKRF